MDTNNQKSIVENFTEFLLSIWKKATYLILVIAYGILLLVQKQIDNQASLPPEQNFNTNHVQVFGFGEGSICVHGNQEKLR